jgi:hypothetical protein
LRHERQLCTLAAFSPLANSILACPKPRLGAPQTQRTHARGDGAPEPADGPSPLASHAIASRQRRESLRANRARADTPSAWRRARPEIPGGTLVLLEQDPNGQPPVDNVLAVPLVRCAGAEIRIVDRPGRRRLLYGSMCESLAFGRGSSGRCALTCPEAAASKRRASTSPTVKICACVAAASALITGCAGSDGTSSDRAVPAAAGASSGEATGGAVESSAGGVLAGGTGGSAGDLCAPDWPRAKPAGFAPRSAPCSTGSSPRCVKPPGPCLYSRG